MGTAQESSGVLQGVVDDVVQALALALHATRAAALVLDPGGQSCRAIATCGLTEAEGERVGRWFTIGDEARPYWERLAAEARPLYVTGFHGTPRVPWRGVVEVPPHLAMPLLDSDGALIGGILLDTAAPTDGDIAIASRMGKVAAVAIEQTRAADTRAAELRRNAVLLDIVREVDRRVELPEVLAAICRKTVEGFGSRQATVFFHSRKHRAALPLADYGTPPHVAARFAGGRYMRGNIPHELDVAEGRTIVLKRDEVSGDDLVLLDTVEVDAIVMVPLRDDDGTARGVLSVGFPNARAFAPAELRALEMVGRHAALAIMRARFLHRTAESARFRASVSALAVELNGATTRAETLHALCSGGAGIFGVDTAAIFLEAGDRLIVAAATGGLEIPDDLVVAFDGADSPVAKAFATGAVVLRHDGPRRDEGEPLERLRSLLAIPLIESEGPIGVLVLGALRPRLFRPEAVDEAPIVGALAASVLRNLELLGQLHESNDRLSRLSAVKDQFLANVSHDLRTPLNVIIGFAQLALEDTFGEPAPELRQILERMLASAHQQLALVQDLLDVSRLELRGLTVKPAPVALAPVFADMEFLATSLVRDKPVRVSVEMPPAELWVHADPDRLRQILTNLLGNAAKFTDAGTIGIRAATAGDRVRVDVVDSGIGIAADEIGAIFEPFRQVDGERARLGAGLGLAIAHRLATLMRGTLSVASRAGEGSTFTLELPALRPPVDLPAASASVSAAPTEP